MAEAISSYQDLFTCPICLDLLRDPVTILCGHNYCMGCIKDWWDREEHKEVYSCPNCKQTFTPRPILYRNNIVDELVEEMRKTSIQTASPAQCDAGPGDVECDVCIGRKRKALKSCLECLLSYCETHFKLHNDVTPGRKHKVIDATGQLLDRICNQHEKPLEIFCRTDQSCICYLCSMDNHNGHVVVSAALEWTEKQKQLRPTQMSIRQRIQGRENELQDLRKVVETLKSSAQTAVEDSEGIFTEMICSIERRRSEVTEMIRAQEKAEVSRAEGLVKRIEEEIAELKSKDAELEQLSNTEDHIHFLKTFQSAIDPPHFKDLSNITINQGLSFEAVKKSASKLKTQLEDFCRQEVMMISAAVSEVQAVCPEPMTRQESFSAFGSASTFRQASGASPFGTASSSSAFGQPSGAFGSAFGQPSGAFGSASTQTGFGQQASGTSLFRQASGASPFGTGTSAGFGFGATPVVQSGQPNQSGFFGLFGNTNQNPPRSGH